MFIDQTVPYCTKIRQKIRTRVYVSLLFKVLRDQSGTISLQLRGWGVPAVYVKIKVAIFRQSF